MLYNKKSDLDLDVGNLIIKHLPLHDEGSPVIISSISGNSQIIRLVYPKKEFSEEAINL